MQKIPAKNIGGTAVKYWQNIKKKPRQEICAVLKWFCFLLNFILFLIGITCLALGIYLWTNDPRTISDWTDIALNPSILLTCLGFAVCVISLCGLFGALRDNVFLLKMFALFVFVGYVLLVMLAFVVFMLFYSDTSDGLSAQSVLVYSIKNYHTNRNIADLVDYLQEQLECCGTSSTSQGFRDWQLNEQFKCNQSNPYPERCGVPYSCCRKTVISEAAGALNPLLPAMRSLQCWQNAQTKKEQDIELDIYTRGCLQPLRVIFEKYALHLGAAVAIIIFPVCLGICLSQCLARQIDYQRYLLERETRRYERRKKREQRYLELKNTDPPSSARMPTAPPATAVVVENEEAAQIAEAIEASKRQYKLEQRQRRAISSLSPNTTKMVATNIETDEIKRERQKQGKEKQKSVLKNENKRSSRSSSENCGSTGIYPRILKQSDFLANAP